MLEWFDKQLKRFNEFDYKVHKAEDGNTDVFYLLRIYTPEAADWFWVKNLSYEYTSNIGQAYRFSTRPEAENHGQSLVKEERKTYNAEQVKLLD